MSREIEYTKSLAFMHPDIANEWDYSENLRFKPEQVSPGSGQKVKWICPICGLSYSARINDRCNPKKKSNCPACFGKKAVKGYSDLATTRPDLAKEWDYEKNPEEKNPHNLKANSHFSAYWKCPKGHPSYKKKIEERNNGVGCPECFLESKTYLSSIPELINEWDLEKNGSYDGITIGSSKPFSWICRRCGNRWIASVNTRSKGHGCEKCSKKEGANKTRLKMLGLKNNSISEVRPDLLVWWDYEKNKDIQPTEVSCSSRMTFNWKCPVCGYSWSTTVDSKSRSKQCPACSGRVVWKGHNDFKSLFPELASEWADDNSVSPEDVLPNSHYLANWKCRICGNVWLSRVAERTRNDTGCSRCKSRYQSSFPEQAVLYYVKSFFSDTIRRFKPKWIGKSEIDIYIPSIKTGIEYDGYNWHKSKQGADEKKGKLINEHSIRLVRIRETGCPDLNDGSVIVRTSRFAGRKDYDSLGKTIREVLSCLRQDISFGDENSFDVARDYKKIYASFMSEVGESSVATLWPSIAAEWDPMLNDGLRPEFFFPGSSVEITWRCSVCGNTWSAQISERCGQDQSGCPVCSNRVIASGINDFAHRYPELLKLWDYENNIKLGFDPATICPSHRAEVYWICEKGHSFSATTASMVRGKRCPYCSNRLVLQGFNDLESTYPEVAKDWDFEGNKEKGLTPKTVVFTSSEEVRWKCHICGHEWSRVIGDRTVRNHGCKKCSDSKKRKNNH